MSSPRLIASLLTVSAAAVLIASCGEQTLPTVPSSVISPTALRASVTEYFDTLVDPTFAPPPGHLAHPPAPGLPIIYPPGSGPDPWPPGPPPVAQPGVPVPTPPSTHDRLHITVTDPVPYSGVPIPLFSC